MTKIEVYEMLLELINSKASSARIKKRELNDYFKPEGILFKQNYLQRLASSLQNSGMMHNSIRFNESEERYNHIKNRGSDKSRLRCRKAQRTRGFRCGHSTRG